MKKPIKIEKVRDSIFWTTASGDEILLSEIEERHLKNVISFLTTKQESFTKLGLGDYIVNEGTAKAWLEIFWLEFYFRAKEKTLVAEVDISSLKTEMIL